MKTLENLTCQGYAEGKQLNPFTVNRWDENHNGWVCSKRKLTDGSVWGYCNEDQVWTPNNN